MNGWRDGNARCETFEEEKEREILKRHIETQIEIECDEMLSQLSTNLDSSHRRTPADIPQEFLAISYSPGRYPETFAVSSGYWQQIPGQSTDLDKMYSVMN